MAKKKKLKVFTIKASEIVKSKDLNLSPYYWYSKKVLKGKKNTKTQKKGGAV